MVAYGVSIGGDAKFWNWMGDGCTTSCTYLLPLSHAL